MSSNPKNSQIFVRNKFLLAKYIIPCHVEDPKLNDCLKNIFNDIMKHIGKGMRELNLPSLDPLFLEATLPIYLNGFRVKYYDLFVRGFSNLSFTDARSNVAVRIL